VSFRAWRTCLDPLPGRVDKLRVRHRRQRPRSSVGTLPRIERPANERLLFVMFQEVRSIEQAQNGATNVPTRKRPVFEVLPSHRQRRKMPVRRAGNTGAVRVRRLMARRAIQRRYTLPFRTPNYIRNVTMPIVTLLRIVRCRVAVDASWRDHDRVDLLPCIETIGSLSENDQRKRQHLGVDARNRSAIGSR